MEPPTTLDSADLSTWPQALVNVILIDNYGIERFGFRYPFRITDDGPETSLDKLLPYGSYIVAWRPETREAKTDTTEASL